MKTDISSKESISAEYNYENFLKHDQIVQKTWQAIKNNKLIDIDNLSEEHIIPFLEMCLDFFAGDEQVIIYFRTSKNRLHIVKRFFTYKKNYVNYEFLGKKGTISYARIYE
jgi:hypothetical protein